VKNL
jgi:hypothetical protein